MNFLAELGKYEGGEPSPSLLKAFQAFAAELDPAKGVAPDVVQELATLPAPAASMLAVFLGAFVENGAQSSLPLRAW
jgi:hypothetical protein